MKDLSFKTSYFAKYKDADGVSVALSTPKWFKGERYPDLFPSWELLFQYKLNPNETIYARRYYNEILLQLDPEKVLTDLNNKVILCYENIDKAPHFCHRRIIAWWIQKYTGVVIKEIKKL